MEIKIIKKPINKKEVADMAKEQFGDLIKATIDTDKEIIALGGELHADEEAFLIEQEESSCKYLWGINLYPRKSEKDWIEFDSMINIKPSLKNYSRNVEDLKVQKKIKSIVRKLIN